MNDLKQINQTPFKKGLATFYGGYNFEEAGNNAGSSTVIINQNPYIKLGDEIIASINKIITFADLPFNWDSYNAIPPTQKAIINSIEFLLGLNNKQRYPSFIAPTPEGGIVIELQDKNIRLEFIFNAEESSEVAGYINNEMQFDHTLNDTTEFCSLRWLYNPNDFHGNWE